MTHWGDGIQLSQNGTLADRLWWLRECAAKKQMRDMSDDADEVAEAIKFYEGEAARLGIGSPDTGARRVQIDHPQTAGRVPAPPNNQASPPRPSDLWATALAKHKARTAR